MDDKHWERSICKLRSHQAGLVKNLDQTSSLILTTPLIFTFLTRGGNWKPSSINWAAYKRRIAAQAPLAACGR